MLWSRFKLNFPFPSLLAFHYVYTYFALVKLNSSVIYLQSFSLEQNIEVLTMYNIM